MKLKKINKKFKIIAVNGSKVINNEYHVNTGILYGICNLKHMVYDTFMLNFWKDRCSHYMFSVFPNWGLNPPEEEENTESEFKDYEGFCPSSVYDESWI